MNNLNNKNNSTSTLLRNSMNKKMMKTQPVTYYPGKFSNNNNKILPVTKLSSKDSSSLKNNVKTNININTTIK